MSRWIAITLLSTAVLWSAGELGDPARAKSPKPGYAAADNGPAKLDVRAYPKPIQDAYGVYESRCSRCHTLARSLNTDLTASGWKSYVKKMMGKPGSGISPKQGKAIYRFLKFYQKVKDGTAKRAPR